MPVMRRIRIEKPANHALVLRLVLPRFVLEELDAALAQRKGNLHPFLSKSEVFGARKKIRNDL